MQQNATEKADSRLVSPSKTESTDPDEVKEGIEIDRVSKRRARHLHKLLASRRHQRSSLPCPKLTPDTGGTARGSESGQIGSGQLADERSRAAKSLGLREGKFLFPQGGWS